MHISVQVHIHLTEESHTVSEYNRIGKTLMHRDMDLIREILLHVEAREDLKARLVHLEGHERLAVDRHVQMLFQAGYLEGNELKTLGMPCPRIMVSDLSWEGHDFLALQKNEQVWEQLKQALSAKELATLPLDVLKDAGMSLAKTWLKKKLGLADR
jgi:hypothetical protein